MPPFASHIESEYISIVNNIALGKVDWTGWDWMWVKIYVVIMGWIGSGH